MSRCSFYFQHPKKGILSGVSTQNWNKHTFGVPTFTCSLPPPHLFCDLCFSLESITGSTQHPWPPCRMKVTNAPTNSARSFYSLSSFHPCERWLVNSCTRNLTAPIGSVILLAHTITLVLFDWTLGIFQISSLTPKYIYVGCHYFAFSNHFLFPLTLSLLTIDQAHENL